MLSTFKHYECHTGLVSGAVRGAAGRQVLRAAQSQGGGSELHLWGRVPLDTPLFLVALICGQHCAPFHLTV